MTAETVHPESVYRRAVPPDRIAPDLRLIALEWTLYFASDGTRTVAELGGQFRANSADRDRAIARLVSAGLLAECSVTAAEFVRARAAAGDQEQRSMHDFLTRITSAEAARPQAATNDTTAAIAPPAPQPRGSIVPLAFKPLSLPEREENRTLVPVRKLSLRTLINAIAKRAGSREAGQLDVYRVFIRVDTSLLKRNGIETLRFTDDRLISDPELEEAIVRSLKRTLGVDCPDDVWVSAV